MFFAGKRDVREEEKRRREKKEKQRKTIKQVFTLG